jgi:hypothetical protein
MYDENTKPIGPGPFERFWGVRNGDGSLKYPMNW